MKIILSRKGFDSKNGGMPSPIFPDGKMISLPIPTDDKTHTNTQIKDLQLNGYNLAKVVSDLKKDPKYALQHVHLDPDINHGILQNRPSKWRGAFGQVDSAQGHLNNEGIGEGDLFIYFGWFREVEQVNGKWQFIKGAKNLHVIYGWLCVKEVIPVKGNVQNVLAKYLGLTNSPSFNRELG